MTEEVAPEVTEVVPATPQEQEQPQDDGGFSAAFEATMSGEDPPQAEATPEPALEAESEPESAPVPPEPTVDERLAAMETRFNNEIARVRDTAAGRIGEVNHRMQQLLQQQRTAGGSNVKLSATSMKRLSEEFPEMAEMLAEDLTEALAGMGGGQPQIDPQVIDQLVTEKTKAIEDNLTRGMEKYKLSMTHKDWQQVVQEDGFNQWLFGQPPDYQQRINNSWDAGEIADALSAYKATRPAKAAVQQQAQQRKQRFADAVTPTQATQTAPVPSTDDDFLAGFKAVRG